MISLILIVIASICNAVMDTVADQKHYMDSVFSKLLREEWWLKTVSWRKKHTNKEEGKWWIPVQFSDAWHTFKTIMIFALVGAIAFDDTVIGLSNKAEVLASLIWFAILGVTWNVIFSLFYNKILKR